MKKTISTITIISLVGFALLGTDTMREPIQKENIVIKANRSKIRPTIDQAVQLEESRLKVQNSRVDEGLAELKFNQ